MIQLESVTKVYRGSHGPVRALDELSLSVERGKFVAVRGPSGSGKSTLLSVIGALHLPTTGSVRVAGRDLHGMSGSQRSRFRSQTVGFVFQMFHLVPYLSVLENVLLPVPPRRRAKGRTRAIELLERFGLSDRLQHRPEQLSTGERQRCAIARALVNDPELVLADEPTGNLDPQSAARVMEHLAEFHQAGGTILLVTHDDAIAALAQTTLTLRAGRIV